MPVKLYFLILINAAMCNNSGKVSGNLEINNARVSNEKRTDDWASQQLKYEIDRLDGVNLIAFGENPNWKLTIASNGNLKFNADSSFGLISASNAESMQPQDLEAMTYGAILRNGTISIMVFPDSCSLVTGDEFPKRIEISVKKGTEIKTFDGCGLYLNDPTIHDIWSLKEWTNGRGAKPIPANAYLEFNFERNLIYGNLGCGDILGNFIPMGSKMEINGLDYDNNTCLQKSESMNLLNHLNFKTHNIIKANLRLHLITDGDTLVFHKSD